MANKVFEADVTTAKGKQIKKRVVLAGLAGGQSDDEDSEFDEKWVEDHIRTHLHPGATAVTVRATKEQAPSSLSSTLQQAAAETNDPELKRKADALAKSKQQEPKPGETKADSEVESK